MIFKLSTKENNAPLIEVEVVSAGVIRSEIVLGELFTFISEQGPKTQSDVILDFDFLIRIQEHYMNQKVFMTRNFVALNMETTAKTYDLKLETFE